jgi:hypothetical protein
MRRSSLTTRHSEDRKWLSDWQDLALYADAKSFNKYHWGMQLSKRAQLLKTTELAFRDAYYRELSEAPLDLGRHGISFPFRQAIQDISHLDIQELVRLHALPNIKELTDEWDAKYATTPIASRFLNSYFVPGNDSSPGWHAVNGIQLHPLLVQAASEEVGMDNCAFERQLAVSFVGVDLTLGDAVLTESFTKWLREKRKKLSQTGVPALKAQPRKASKRHQSTFKTTESSMRSWHADKVLPYIDIRIRAKFDNRKLPSSEVIGEHLYPGHEGAGAKVRQKLALVSRDLLQLTTIRRLLDEGVASILIRSIDSDQKM